MIEPLHLELQEPRYPTYGMEADACELTNRATEVYLAGNSYEALKLIKTAVGMKRCIPTLVNTTIILESIGRFREAFPYIKEAYEIAPEDENAMLLYSEALLRMENYTEGWPIFEKRRAKMIWLERWKAEWQGEPLAGKRIAVIEKEECGVGDDLYFFRNVLELRALGAEVTFACRPSLVPLIEAQGIRCLANYGGHCNIRWTDYDYFCSVLLLGPRLGMKWKGPYIQANERWWKKLGRKRVGICWKAGETLSQKETRFLTDEQIKTILAALPKDYDWVNLTYGQEPIGRMKHGKMDNWLSTAKTIATCDLVVSVDTGVGHLAAAMGIKTWVVLPGAAAWCYPLGHDIHPHYPSMRIFRNPYEGMEEAVSELCFALGNL